MELEDLAIESKRAWLELVSGSIAGSTWTHGSGIAVVTEIASNSDNGVVLDRAALNHEVSVHDLVQRVLEARVPATLILSEAVPAEELLILERLGLEPENSAFQMAMPLSVIAPHDPPDGVRVEEVTSKSQLRAGLRVLGEDWFDDAELEQRLNCLVRLGIGPQSQVRHWLASRDGLVVAMATSFRFGDAVELAHCGVLTSERRKGIATSLTAVRLSSAIEDGATQAVLSPSPDGYELHRTLGFETTSVPGNRLFCLPIPKYSDS